MTIKLFQELRADCEQLRAERDLYEAHLGVLAYRHMALIGGIKVLADMLQVKRPTKAQTQAAEAHVNRLIDMARSHYTSLLADERAVANLRKATHDD